MNIKKKLSNSNTQNEKAEWSIRTKLNLIMYSALLVLAITYIVGFFAFEKTKVNGVKYKDIIQSKNLVADVLPPPEYIIETYLVVFQLTENTNPSEINNLLEKCEILKREYYAKHEIWKTNLKDNDEMKYLLIEKSFYPADNFFKILDKKFIPLIKENKKEEARNLAFGELNKNYLEHRYAIDEVVKLAIKQVSEVEGSADKLVNNHLNILIILGVFIILILIIGAIVINKLSEIKIQEGEENLSVTLDSIGDAVIVTNAQGNITRINRVAAQLICCDVFTVYGKSLHEILKLSTESDVKVIFPINDILEKKTVVAIRKNMVLVDNTNSKKYISYCGAPILGNTNTILGAVIVFRDISKEHELEAQLRHIQKMEALGQLAGGIAHDFNNLLTGIIGCANIIKRKSNDSAIVNTYAEHIITSGKRSADLTRKLLDFSRRGKLSNSVFNLHKIIEDTTHLIDKSLYKRIEIKQNFKANRSSIEGDPGQIQNSFLNLFINACHAMNGMGELIISTENILFDVDLYSKLELKKESHYIKIEVQDSGSGISPENISKVFDPFFTTKELGKGTGLGLASVYGAIKEHDGSIQVSSDFTKGTKFTIYLPTSHFVEKTESTTAIEQKDSPAKGIRSLLLADDEPIIRVTIKELLDDPQLNVIEASNGEEAIKLFNDHKLEIDFVILDLIMPKIYGNVVFQEIRKISPEVPVLFISGYKKDLTSLPASDKNTAFLQKPFESEEFFSLIKKLKKT